MPREGDADPVPQSVAVGEIANSAVDDDSGPPTVLPLASSDVVDPRIFLRTMGVSSPAWARIRSFLTRTCRLPPNPARRNPRSGANPRGWYSPPIGRGITWSGRFAGLATCCSRYWRWPWLRWPLRVPEWYREEIESRAGGRWSGAAYRVARSRLAARPRTHAQGSELCRRSVREDRRCGVAPDWYGVAARGRLSTRLSIEGLRGRPRPCSACLRGWIWSH